MSTTDQTNGETPQEKPSKKPSPNKPWLIIGKMRYGTKRTEEYLNKQAAFILAHPELYSIHARAKRIEIQYYEYKFAINTSEIVIALNISMREAQRMLQETRIRLHKEKNDYVGISEFCRMHKLNEKAVRIAIVPAPR